MKNHIACESGIDASEIHCIRGVAIINLRVFVSAVSFGRIFYAFSIFCSRTDSPGVNFEPGNLPKYAHASHPLNSRTWPGGKCFGVWIHAIN